jgi:hypothetical protein
LEAYDTATDSWSTKALLSVGKSLAAIERAGATIIAAGALSDSGLTTDNEAHATKKMFG